MAREEKKKHERRARGGAMPDEDMKKPEMRKRGGMVHGKKMEMRPDRRARGGATSDADPFTTAGKMSSPDYESKQTPADQHGKGADRD